MAELVRGRSITGAWVGALEALYRFPEREIYDLLVEVEEPTAVAVDIVSVVDEFLAGWSLQSTDTVANTIFPERLALRCPDREMLYRRYERLLPRIRRRSPKNRRGTYFGRLIEYPLQPDPQRSNQLEHVITELRAQDPARPMRHIYEMQLYAPGKDQRPVGFPCMSSLSLHLCGGRLRLAATYRNQYWVERGLGNLIGLARLQRYIAHESGLLVGALSVHAFHVKLDRSPRNLLGRLKGDVESAASHAVTGKQAGGGQR